MKEIYRKQIIHLNELLTQYGIKIMIGWIYTGKSILPFIELEHKIISCLERFRADALTHQIEK